MGTVYSGSSQAGVEAVKSPKNHWRANVFPYLRSKSWGGRSPGSLPRGGGSKQSLGQRSRRTLIPV